MVTMKSRLFGENPSPVFTIVKCHETMNNETVQDYDSIQSNDEHKINFVNIKKQKKEREFVSFFLYCLCCFPY
jgi:hypothetical protein